MTGKQTLFIALFTGIGGLFAVIGYAMLYHTLRFLRVAVRARATVVGYDPRTSTSNDNRTSTFYHAKIEFMDQLGMQHNVTMSVGTGSPSYPEGSIVDILFDPDRPERARIDSFSHLWLFPLVFGGMGTIFVVIGLVVWLLRIPVG